MPRTKGVTLKKTYKTKFTDRFWSIFCSHDNLEITVCFCLDSGLVPLHNACSYGHYEVAELLVRHGASVNVADLWKFTPLHEAAAKGKYEICKLLLKVRHAFTLNSC